MKNVSRKVGHQQHPTRIPALHNTMVDAGRGCDCSRLWLKCGELNHGPNSCVYFGSGSRANVTELIQDELKEILEK